MEDLVESTMTEPNSIELSIENEEDVQVVEEGMMGRC